MNLEEIVELYKKEHNTENYHNLLKYVFKDISQILWLPSRIREDNNGVDLKSVYDSNGKFYVVAYTNSKFIKEEDEIFIKMTIKGILEIILASEKCNGLCIDPDININLTNMYKQCILTKDDIIKIQSI